MLAFDAATREECAAERNRSNIPQQALVLLNDPSYVEAARSFAARILRESSGDDAARLTWAWRQALSRAPQDSEVAALRRLLESQRTAFAKDPQAASKFTQTGKAPTPAGLDPVQWAAWTDVARALLNLHETITRS
jgi:murein L,D-transpeptidase YcbB/YkuD